jgi:hypothetical protein
MSLSGQYNFGLVNFINGCMIRYLANELVPNAGTLGIVRCQQ